MFIAFYFIGIDRKIGKSLELRNSKELFAIKANPFKKHTFATKIYHVLLFLVTTISLVICFFNSHQIKSLVCKRYLIIVFFMLVIKKLIVFILFKIYTTIR
jgi:hypothetical protein